MITEGRWFHEKLGDRSMDVSIYSILPMSNNPKYIARVYGNGYMSSLVDERNSNVKLLTASPLLLDALKLCECELSLNVLSARMTSNPSAWEEAVRQARVAIQKATE